MGEGLLRGVIQAYLVRKRWVGSRPGTPGVRGSRAPFQLSNLFLGGTSTGFYLWRRHRFLALGSKHCSHCHSSGITTDAHRGAHSSGDYHFYPFTESPACPTTPKPHPSRTAGNCACTGIQPIPTPE